MKKTLAKVVTHREFLKMCGLAAIGAGASQIVTAPQPVYAQQFNEDVYVMGKLGVGTTTPISGLAIHYITGADALTIGNVSSGTTGKRMKLGYNFTNDVGLIYAVDEGVAYKNLGLAPYGGNVGIGTGSPGALLDVSSGGLTLLLGADNVATTRTNLTTKACRVGTYHYTNAEEPVGIIVAGSDTTSNFVCIGGGSSLINAANYVSFYTAANQITTTGTERVRIDAAGKVGIGTSGPDDKVTIQSAGNSGLTIRQNTTVNRFKFFVGDGTGGTVVDENYIRNLNTTLHIQNGAAGATETVTILQGGNVGIGTTGPGYKLDVSSGGSLGVTNQTAAPTNSQSLPGSLNFDGFGWNTLLGSQAIKGQILLSGAYASSSGSVEPYLAFSLKGTGGNANPTPPGPSVLTEVMRITNGGNVGIGTPAPTARLEVAGEIKVNGIVAIKTDGVAAQSYYAQ